MAPIHGGDVSADQTDPAPAKGRTGAHPVLVYTLLRIAVLAGTGAVLYLLGLRGFWLLLFAFLLSGIASIFLLNRTREQAAGGVVNVVQKVNQRIESSAAAEDALVAQAAAPSAQPAEQAATEATEATEAAGDAEQRADGTVDRAAERAAADRAARNAIPADDDLDHLEPDDR